MKCPVCKSIDSDRVVNARGCFDGEITHRRRECMKCKSRWTTYEMMLKINVHNRQQSIEEAMMSSVQK
jgi:transcriptional repressor NrdR